LISIYLYVIDNRITCNIIDIRKLIKKFTFNAVEDWRSFPSPIRGVADEETHLQLARILSIPKNWFIKQSN